MDKEGDSSKSPLEDVQRCLSSLLKEELENEDIERHQRGPEDSPSILSLNKDTEATKVKHQLSQNLKLLECLQCGKDLYSTLFSSSQSIEPSHTYPTIRPLVLKQVELVEVILKEYMELKKLREELEGIKKERLQCVEELREMSTTLQNFKIVVQPSNTQNSQALVEMKKKIVLLSCTLQSLIVASKANWSSDLKLLELIIQLGKY